MRFRIYGIKVTSRGSFEGKQVIKFAITSNRGQVCLFHQKCNIIYIVMQNVHFGFRQDLRHYCLLSGKSTYDHLHP